VGHLRGDTAGPICLGRPGNAQGQRHRVSPAEVAARPGRHGRTGPSRRGAASDTDGLRSPWPVSCLSSGAIGERPRMIGWQGRPAVLKTAAGSYSQRYPTTATRQDPPRGAAYPGASIIAGEGPVIERGAPVALVGAGTWGRIAQARLVAATGIVYDGAPRAPPRGRSPRSATGSPASAEGQAEDPVDCAEGGGRDPAAGPGRVRDRGGSEDWPVKQPCRRPGEGRLLRMRLPRTTSSCPRPRSAASSATPDAWWGLHSSTGHRDADGDGGSGLATDPPLERRHTLGGWQEGRPGRPRHPGSS